MRSATMSSRRRGDGVPRGVRETSSGSVRVHRSDVPDRNGIAHGDDTARVTPMPAQNDEDEQKSTSVTTVPLLEPRDGVPEVVTTARGVADAAAMLAQGHGPLAVDAERASGYRYSARAYLVQLRRDGAGTVLLDPIPTRDDLAPLAEVIND